MINTIGTSIRDLYKPRPGKRLRISSYDTTGGNRDFVRIKSGESTTIFHSSGAGCITHIWMTMMEEADEDAPFLPRKVLLRMFWDGEAHPSVEAPIGDFFGMGHGLTRNYSSAVLSMSPEDGKSFNSFFPMPFSDDAQIEIQNDSERTIRLYYYIDYERYSEPLDNPFYFHAMWKRELTQGSNEGSLDNALFSFSGKNTTGDKNYVILDAEGRGHYVGCNMNIHNLRSTREWNWYGEGDDMIFIDGENWPPALHGTGMEDYFNSAWCPTQEYHGLYHGILMGGESNWSGKVSYYRHHIQDPVMFDKSVRVTIEHGHNNQRSDDYSSTAYWYQTEPHKEWAPMPQVADRLPLPDILPFNERSMDKCFDY